MLRRYSYSFASLWTVCSITIFKEDDTGLDDIIQTACAQVVRFEDIFSRFRKESILSRLNIDKAVIVNDDFVDLFLCAKKIYAFTDGYFNPLLDIRALGYIENFEDTKHFSIQDISEDLDMDAIVLDQKKIILRPSMHIDFWAIGKGYIADRIGMILEQQGCTNFIINLGGDIVIRGMTTNATSPTVGIISPKLAGFIGSISLSNASVSTSGSYVRSWAIDGKEYHHIKTPWESIQNDSLWSVTIVSKFWYESDALATAVFAMGWDKWFDFCEGHCIDALFITKDSVIRYTTDFNTKYALRI